MGREPRFRACDDLVWFRGERVTVHGVHKAAEGWVYDLLTAAGETIVAVPEGSLRDEPPAEAAPPRLVGTVSAGVCLTCARGGCQDHSYAGWSPDGLPDAVAARMAPGHVMAWDPPEASGTARWTCKRCPAAVLRYGSGWAHGTATEAPCPNWEVTGAGLVQLRTRLDRLRRARRDLEALGLFIPAELVVELEQFEALEVLVLVPCMLCRKDFGCSTAVADVGVPETGICGACSTAAGLG